MSPQRSLAPQSKFSKQVFDAFATPRLKRRDSQIKMALAIAQVLTGEWPEPHAAIEAGTGTGKSLAYLVPVMMYCVENGARAIVATGTKNLQDQLVKKDAPLAAEMVESITGKRPTFAVLYGKVNYLCLKVLQKRLNKMWKEASKVLSMSLWKDPVAYRQFEEELCWLDMLDNWLKKGGNGLKDCIPAWSYLPGSQADRDRWWARVSADDEDVDCSDCPHQDCRFKAARAIAEHADVVLANHHLVVMDFLLRQKAANLSLFASKDECAPRILVIDEAHDFPDALRGVLEVSFTVGRVKRLRADILGLMEEMAEWAKDNCHEQVAYILKNLNAASRIAERSYPSSEMSVLLKALNERMGKYDERLLIFPGSAPQAEAESLVLSLDKYFSNLMDFPVQVLEALDIVSKNDGVLRSKFEKFRIRCKRLSERADELLEAVHRAVMAEKSYRLVGPTGDACWYERGRAAAAPVDISKTARELWKQYDHVIFTSATLYPFPQSGGFAWFRSAFGLAENEVILGIAPSPFQFDKQMRAAVLKNPDLLPVDYSYLKKLKREEKQKLIERRIKALVESVLRVVEKSHGGVLVLFTSYFEMWSVADAVRGKLPPGRVLLVQGQDGGKMELLRRFKEHGKGVLFGTASFWQGVDVPGDALKTLVIAKLPFPAPDNPFIEAMCWLMKKDGWKKVQKPLTVLALRQGVGRLIRTESDAGLVVICDPRAVTRHRWSIHCLPVIPEEWY